MAVYQLKTLADIVNGVLDAVKIQSTDAAQIIKIKRDINLAYLNLVVPRKSWTWLKKEKDLTIKAYINSGTATVVKGSNQVTLSIAPTDYIDNFLFATDGYAEIYRIRSVSGAVLTLDSPFTGENGSVTYKIWNDSLPLPVEFIDVDKIWHDHDSNMYSTISQAEFIELVLSNPRLSSKPTHYSVGETINNTNEYGAISGLPAVSTRASAGLVKTLVFASSVASYIEVGDRLRIRGAGNEAYNDDVIVGSVSANYVTYITTKALNETTIADTGIVVTLKGGMVSEFSYKELFYYPSLTDTDITLHVTGINKVAPLENDEDEPVIPVEDRIVLLYGALARTWARQRNESESVKNYQLFEKKLDDMASASKEKVNKTKLTMSEFYLASKRRGMTTMHRWNEF